MQLATRAGFSLIETMVAVLMLAIVSSGIFLFISGAGRSSMDSYYEFLALQACREPVEVFRCFGYDRVKKSGETRIADYEIDQWQVMSAYSDSSAIDRPEAIEMFERYISLNEIEYSGMKGLLVKVMVRPGANSAADRFVRRESVSFSSIIWEQPR